MRITPLNAHYDKKMMFGEVIQELDSTVWFQNKPYILEESKKINSLRIQTVHSLLKKYIDGRIEEQKNEVIDAYKITIWYSLEAHFFFRSRVEEYFKDPNWPPENTGYYSDSGMVYTV